MTGTSGLARRARRRDEHDRAEHAEPHEHLAAIDAAEGLQALVPPRLPEDLGLVDVEDDLEPRLLLGRHAPAP